MHAVGDVLGERSFLVALAVALVGALTALTAARSLHRLLPVGGAVVVGATAAGLVAGDVVPSGTAWLVVGTLLMALGASAHRAGARLVGLVALAAGACSTAVAATRIDPRAWVGVVVVVTAVAGALGAGRLDASWARFGAGPALFAITAGGVFVCVPDTEQAIPLMAAAIGLLIALWPPVRVRLGAGGAAAVVGLVLWTAAVGGTGRAGSVVGGVGCLGVFVVAPAVDAWLQRTGARPWCSGDGSIADALILSTVHALLVLFCARVAGFRSSAPAAGVLVLLAYATAVLVLVTMRRPAR